MAMALDGEFVEDRSKEQTAAECMDRLLLAATADESKSETRQPGQELRPGKALVTREPEEGLVEYSWLRRSYFGDATNLLMKRGSNPPTIPVDPKKKYTTEHYTARWIAIGEVHAARRLSDVRFDIWDRASRTLGRVLRHSSDESAPPCRLSDASLGGEIAFALLLQKHVFRQGDSPRTLYDAMMLKEKDRGRPRFQVLVRYPTTEEKEDEVADRYIFRLGALSGMILLRIRSVQGHSGETMQRISRVGHVVVEKAAVPRILMHSTLSAHLEHILKKGLLPGGPRHERVDSFFVGAEEFAKKIAQAKAGPDSTAVTWKDPVHDLHMRTKSDVVMMYSGTLMYEDNVNDLAEYRYKGLHNPGHRQLRLSTRSTIPRKRQDYAH